MPASILGSPRILRGRPRPDKDADRCPGRGAGTWEPSDPRFKLPGMSARAPGEPDRGAATADRLVALLRRKPLTPRRAAFLIAGYTSVVTFAGALIAWLTDRKDFEHFGEALWWALQTVTTVGYGDVVVSTGTGRIIGAFVMISGIAFLTVITAAVTAALIEGARRRRALDDEHEQLPETLREISARLSAIERRLDEQGSQGRG